MNSRTLLGAVAAAAILAGSGLSAQDSDSGTVAGAQALAPVDLKEWDVPWADTRPRDPFAVSASEVWFVGQGGHYAAMLNP